MAVSTVEGRRGNLPADLTSFVGRRHEIADVKHLLSASRLVTLTGMGGVGKTRLALRVAWDVRRGFPDGVWLVELAGLRDPRLVGQTLAASLGLHDRSVDESLAWLTSVLGGRQMLIVLDNCEHVLDASAVLAHALLRASPRARILATSRQALGIDGEHLMVVPPLSVPEPGRPTSPEGLGNYEAVNLFVERAAAVQPGFRLDPANQAAVAAICRRLEGIPLAVELAATRVRVLTVDELIARLDDRYALLTGGSRAALPRQQTLQSLIDWSFELCSDAERLLWARVSVFAGGFDLAAAERVCSDDAIRAEDVWDLVTRLVDKSIVVVSDGVVKLGYQLSETLREYGRDRLAELGETDRFAGRHRDWYRELINDAEANWFGADQVQLFARLRREHANLREALSFCLTHPGQVDIGLTMASALRFYWVVSGRVREGSHWLRQLLAQSTERSPARLKAMCVNAYLATIGNELTEAADLLREARSLAASLEDASENPLISQVEGLTALFQDDPERARPLFHDALNAHRSLGDEPAAIFDQIELALSSALLGDRAGAKRLLEDCLNLTQSRGDHWLRALTLWALGIEQCKEGDYERAAAAQLESLRLRAALDDKWTIGLNVQVLGWVASATGDAGRGARLMGASEAIGQSVGLTPMALGHVTHLQQNYEEMGRQSLTKAGFQRAYDEGRRLTFDDAVGLALGEPQPSSGRAVRDTTDADLLTKREKEVADLVRRGLSNKEIAAALVISQRTAETHVEHILTKLGLSSRTQVAAWLSDQQQPPAS